MGENKTEIVTDFIFLGSKITAEGDCSHEIKRHFLLGRISVPNLERVLKSRGITLPTKFCTVKAMVFPVQISSLTQSCPTLCDPIDQAHQAGFCVHYQLPELAQIHVCKVVGFSSGHVQMWELDHKEGWVPKNWSFGTVVLEMILESPLDWEIKPVSPKGNQRWVFIGKTDA